MESNNPKERITMFKQSLLGVSAIVAAIAMATAITARAASDPISASSASSFEVGNVLPTSITPPHIVKAGRSTRRHAATRQLASLTATVQCNDDLIYVSPLRDGRTSGGEWMYWWPRYDNATFFYDIGYVDGGPMFANRAGTNTFYVSNDGGKTWSGASSTVLATMTPFYWGNLMYVDDEVQYIPDHGTPTAWIDLGLRMPASYTGPHAYHSSYNGGAACQY
jgi:hypothetical protein